MHMQAYIQAMGPLATLYNDPDVTEIMVDAYDRVMVDLIGFGSVTEAQYALLKSALRTRQNILIAGGTNSGKSTVANVLTDEFSDDERIVVVESVYVLQPLFRYNQETGTIDPTGAEPSWA